MTVLIGDLGGAGSPARRDSEGAGCDELQLTTTYSARALLLGGVLFPEHLTMWWNFVARTREEMDAAYNDWTAAAERFGKVQSRLPRPMGRPPTT
jgi:hypothetical protein